MPTREERFNGLHEQHFEAIRRYAYRRSPALADDIVAETFLVAWRRIDAVPDDARPWLFGVARNVRLNLQRSSRRQLALTERLTGEIAASAPADGVAVDDAIAGALAGLSERDREILLLHAWGELSYEEIADALEIPVGTVRSRLSRARASLQAALAQSFRTQQEVS